LSQPIEFESRRVGVPAYCNVSGQGPILLGSGDSDSGRTEGIVEPQSATTFWATRGDGVSSEWVPPLEGCLYVRGYVKSGDAWPEADEEKEMFARNIAVRMEEATAGYKSTGQRAEGRTDTGQEIPFPLPVSHAPALSIDYGPQDGDTMPSMRALEPWPS
jgi:hypothetical protein